ncbi:hypothetical protein DCC85_09420 [Paenibacillus sp. CAA11]|uniref:outer membrane protein assembly factor BamB family protein n=1 Tax=Paenibacillus sp. CAA11 TaxID=1532905 RepID=UPI000D3CA214|nr:PQQ-binding-like beta-propeller repeat protein [Paenibacillus sp. CAA11]AWB44425.1 hypothetical protein DCC85_09420 [Paenibacillus sp. CAA11]
MVNRLMKRTCKTVVCLALASSMTGVAGQGQAQAAPALASISNPILEIKIPDQAPKWSVDIDRKDITRLGEGGAVSGQGMVFAVKKGRLIALDAVSGTIKWRSGSSLTPNIVFQNGRLYGIDQDGRVSAFNVNGKKLWTSTKKVVAADKIIAVKGKVYILRGIDLYALNGSNGKLEWEHHDTEAEVGLGDLMVSDGVVLRTYVVQGALSAVQLNAFDAATGKKLWGKFRYNYPLAVKDGAVYSVYEQDPIAAFAEKTPQLAIKVFNLRTGMDIGERSYSWLTGSVKDLRANSKAILQGNDLFTFGGGVIAKYDFSHYEGPDGKPVQKWLGAGENGDMPVSQVIANRVFIWNSGNPFALKAVKLANGQGIGYRFDNPVSQVDITEKAVFAGQTDGVWVAANLQTTLPVMKVRTGSRNYGPTLTEKGMAIIQTEDKLFGVSLPSAIK